jgi:hypothetical protein
MQESGNWGRPEISSWQDIRLPDGRVVKQGYDRFGAPVGSQVTPYVKPEMVNRGDRIEAVDPTQVQPGQQFGIGVSPDTRYSGSITMRGQNMTDARARETLQQTAQQGGQLVYNADANAYLPKTILPGQVPQPVQVPGMGPPKGSMAEKQQRGEEVKFLLNEAEQILAKGNATGSRLGQARDFVAGELGISTRSAEDSGRLKVIAGALVSATPRLEGPQGVLDLGLYREATGKVGDDSLPIGVRLAAVQTAKSILRRNGIDVGSGEGTRSVSGTIKPANSGGWSLTPLD